MGNEHRSNASDEPDAVAVHAITPVAEHPKVSAVVGEARLELRGSGFTEDRLDAHGVKITVGAPRPAVDAGSQLGYQGSRNDGFQERSLRQLACKVCKGGSIWFLPLTVEA